MAVEKNEAQEVKPVEVKVEEQAADELKQDESSEALDTKLSVKEKEADEETNANGDNDTEQSKPAEDATLILSAEEEAEIAAQTNEDAVKTSTTKKTPVAKSTKAKQSANVWVSNILRTTKAADLKKVFTDKYKVESAKIVTNGRSFFGYICLETPEMAQTSVKELNGTLLNGRKLTVSLTRPDLKATRTGADNARRTKDPKKESRVSNGKKSESGGGKKTADNDDKKAGDGAAANQDAEQATTGEKDKDNPEELLKQLRRREQRNSRIIQDLKTDLNRVNAELQNNRRRLSEATRRLESEKERKTSLHRELQTMESQLKSERRRFAQDLETMEKKRKSDELRYQEDRSVLNKELDECRKLREYLQKKVDEMGMSRHGRSPRRNMTDKMMRSRMDNRGGARSPPPAPKIARRSSRDRSPYKGNKKLRIDDSSNRPFGNSQYQNQSSSYGGGAKPLIIYPPNVSGGPSRQDVYGSTSYPEPHRYGGNSSGYPSGGYSMGNPMMSRSMGYPNSSNSQRKY